MNRYAIADLHGQLDLLEQVKEYLNEDDVLYILGDSGDRGPHPWRTLKASLDDTRFTYLMGNHDLMLIKAIEQYIKIPESELMYGLAMYMGDRTPIGQLALNGGTDTLLGWAREPERMKYYQKLRFAPLEVRLAALDGEHFIYLTHAGLVPHIYTVDTVDSMVWNREHFYNKPLPDGTVSIYGHTPTEVVVKKLRQCGRALDFDDSKGYLSHANGTKINIDIGAYFYNKTVLLNIDTLEGKIFTTKGES